MEISLSGSVSLKTEDHIVEYDHEGFHSSNLFLRLNKQNTYNVPIYVDQVDEAIEMLKRGKAAIEALEPRNNE